MRHNIDWNAVQRDAAVLLAPRMPDVQGSPDLLDYMKMAVRDAVRLAEAVEAYQEAYESEKAARDTVRKREAEVMERETARLKQLRPGQATAHEANLIAELVCCRPVGRASEGARGNE
jgi:hypothetical protein